MASQKKKGPMKAYEDIEFLNRKETRSLRLQAEYLKPQLQMNDMDVIGTVVIFGSARTQEPKAAKAALRKAKTDSRKRPRSQAAKRQLSRAEHDVRVSEYYDMARDLGAQIGKLGLKTPELDFVVNTGGGPGIMEAANRGAHDVGAKSIGLNISLPFEQSGNPYITDELNFVFHYFSIRKMHFLLRAEAACFFPGGFGTMDELFETLTLIQTGKQRKIPLVMFGREYWEELINWELFVEWGMINAADLKLMRYVDTVDEGMDVIRKYAKVVKPKN